MVGAEISAPTLGILVTKDVGNSNEVRTMRDRLFRDDRGIGMTELAVAIVLLGIVLVGLAPLMVNAIGLAQSNSEVGRANRIVSSQLDAARIELAETACAPETATPLGLADADSSTFAAIRTVSCNTALTLATITVDVARITEPAQPISTATTQVVTSP